MSRTFHPYGRPCWRRPITHRVHQKRWDRFKRTSSTGCGGVPWSILLHMNWRWPKSARVIKNRKFRKRCRQAMLYLDHEARCLPLLLEQYHGWYL